ncbi:MAG: hypothetical protein AAFQ27_01100 [Pseudomonadota bacterium]
MKNSTIFAALALALAAPSKAQDQGEIDTLPAPSLTAEDIRQMCSANGVFQFAFGEVDVPGSTRIEKHMQMAFPLPDRFAPLVRMQTFGTAWSRQLARAEFQTKPFDEDVIYRLADVPRFADALGPVLESDGWTRVDIGDPLDTPMYLIGSVGEYTWEREIAWGDETSKLYFNIDAFAGQAVLTCTHDRLSLVLLQEGLGKIPDGTPRPKAPDLPFVPVPDLETCLSPAYNPELEAFMESGKPNGFLGALLVRSDHHTKLSQWIGWRLKSAGMDKDELFKMTMESVTMDDGINSFGASLNLFGQIFPLLDKLSEARKSRDRMEACRGFVAITDILNKLETNAQAQTVEFEKRARVHAERLGISLD